MPWEIKQEGNQYCLFNKNTGAKVKGSCHSNKEDTRRMQQAMYAAYNAKGGAMAEITHSHIAFAEQAHVEDDGLLWVEAMPAKTWHTGLWGEVPITEEKLQNFVKNFNEGVRGIEVTTDFDHGMDRSKGNRASGTYKKLEVRQREDGIPTLYAGIEATPVAMSEIQDGEWKYFSLEWEDEWMNEANGNVYKDVVTGGGFTNKPIAKGIMPVNFSEVYEEKDVKQFAVWSTAYVNNLPDSAFFWIEPGGSKVDGKTEPRSKRHLPYKDANGNVDLAHVRNAMARVSQVKGVPPGVVSRVKTMGARLLKAKSMSEVMMIEAECAPEEFQEPGTGIIDPSINEDDSAEGGWRRETPTPEGEDGSIPPRPVTNPNDKGGENGMPMSFSEEQLKELRKLLEVEGDDTEINEDLVINRVKAFSEELTPLRELKARSESKKKFAEEYPEEAARLEKLQERDREHFVKSFSESFEKARISKPVGEPNEEGEVKTENTTLGFSALVINTLGETAKKFSEGNGGLADVKEVVDAILNNGIVDYGNKGSDRGEEPVDDDVVPQAGTMAARMAFSEKIDEIRKKDELEFEPAFNIAAERYPELAAAWRQPIVAA